MKTDRRSFLRAMSAIPAAVVTLKGKDVGRSFEITPDSKYVVILNAAAINIDDFCRNETAFPPGTAIHCVHPADIDDAIRIFKVSE